MAYIDPHIHMVSRTTDDYQAMAEAGCVAITEPAFWAGFDRSSPAGFYDYFRQLTEVEPKRAAGSAVSLSMRSRAMSVCMSVPMMRAGYLRFTPGTLTVTFSARSTT